MVGIGQNFYSSNIITSSLTTSSLTFGTGSGYLFLPNTVMNSLSVGIIYASTIVGFTPGGTGIGGGIVSTANLANLVSTTYLASQLGSTIIGLGTAGYLSSIPSLGGFVSTANLANLVSTANLAGHISTANLANLVSTANLANLVSTTYLATQIGSTVIGLGTAGYLSTIVFGSIVSTANLAGHVSTANLANLVSTANLANLVSTANVANLVSTTYLATQIGSTVIGLGTAGYLSTIVFGSIVSTANLAGHVSTANLANLVSTANLANLISTANLAGHISTANLANLVSTANLANLVSTSYLNTQLGSTMTGISQNFYSSNIFTSSLITSSLTFGTGSGYLFLPNSIMNSLSVGILYASTIVGFTPGGSAVGGGLVSTANLANLVSTSLLDTAFGSTLTSLENEFTTNTLLTPFIKNKNFINISSVITTIESDDITVYGRNSIFLTTSSVVTFDRTDGTGSCAAALSSIFFVNTNTNAYGQITTEPTMTNLYWNGSQLNDQGGGGGGISQANLTSTVIGLGTVGYISTAGGGGGISQTDLTSTVIGLGTLGYVSTPGANDLFSTLITSTLQTAHILNTSEYLFMDAPVTLFAKPDFSSFYPIAVSSISLGGGQISTDPSGINLYWNDSQVNSQYGFVTLAFGRSVATYDANITASTIILVTPYGDIGYGNTFWVTLDTGTFEWLVHIASALAGPVDFSYHILKY
jgi:hypothetical protein